MSQINRPWRIRCRCEERPGCRLVNCQFVSRDEASAALERDMVRLQATARNCGCGQWEPRPRLEYHGNEMWSEVGT
jgi:hypothetical protein